jgi:hypothetical protein
MPKIATIATKPNPTSAMTAITANGTIEPKPLARATKTINMTATTNRTTRNPTGLSISLSPPKTKKGKVARETSPLHNILIKKREKGYRIRKE